MSAENVIHLSFRPTNASSDEGINFIACKHCKNKTFTLTEEGEEQFPLLKCAACGSHIGHIGWTA